MFDGPIYVHFFDGMFKLVLWGFVIVAAFFFIMGKWVF